MNRPVSEDQSKVPDRQPRKASINRSTAETTVNIELNVDGSGVFEVTTGLPFFDHMLAQLARHGGWDVKVKVDGDLEVDAHHSVEDAGIVLGSAISQALGDRRGIRRFASMSLPLDEALVDVALDVSGRPFLHWDVALPPQASPLGNPGFDPQLAEEFWRAVVIAAGLTLHVDLRRGVNSHHIVEAVFKAIARSLAHGTQVIGGDIPSTKGSL